MKFVLVNGRMPRAQDSCAFCCEPIADGYVRDIATGRAYCSRRCYVDRDRTSFRRLRHERARAS